MKRFRIRVRNKTDWWNSFEGYVDAINLEEAAITTDVRYRDTPYVVVSIEEDTLYKRASETLEQPLKLKNILQSLHDDITEGKIDYRQAGVELYKAGWFNFLPDENTIKALLKL